MSPCRRHRPVVSGRRPVLRQPFGRLRRVGRRVDQRRRGPQGPSRRQFGQQITTVAGAQAEDPDRSASFDRVEDVANADTNDGQPARRR